MDSAMTRFAIRAAYGASQLPRVAWYIGHGFVMGRLAERMRQQERQRTRPRAHSDTPVPDRARLYRDMAAGGCIGQSLGRQVPEWLDGLILSATWLKPSRDMARLSGARRAVLDENPCAYAAMATLLAYPPAWLEADWSVYEAALANAPMTPQARHVVRERIDALLSFDGSADIVALAVPALVLGARDDMIIPAFMQDELAAALPDASKIMLDFRRTFLPCLAAGSLHGDSSGMDRETRVTTRCRTCRRRPSGTRRWHDQTRHRRHCRSFPETGAVPAYSGGIRDARRRSHLMAGQSKSGQF